MEDSEINDELLEDLYRWIDEIPLSRTKRDMRRDFSDAVLVAEIVHHYFPQSVELHNYISAQSTEKKITNWRVLNRKVLSKLFGFNLDNETIRHISGCRPWAIEKTLMFLHTKIDRKVFGQKKTGSQTKPRNTHRADVNSDSPDVDQLYNVNPNDRVPSYKETTTYSQSSPPKHTPTIQSPKVDLRLDVEQKQQEILVKDETIQILQAKVRRLEHLLHLKDIRIDDLQENIATLEHKLQPAPQLSPLNRRRR